MRKLSKASEQGRGRRRSSTGFTLVELMVVLLVMAILATMAGAGLSSYLRMARFRHNEANAKTVFQMATVALTRKATSGEMEAFLKEVTQNGINGDSDGTKHFTDTDPDETADNTELDRRNSEIYALFYDRADPTTASSRMVAELLGPYLYDTALLSASLCLEVDGLTGQVYAVFYDTNARRLRFGQDTKIEDRSYKHREEESLVGYYSALDQVNVITLDPSKLRVQSTQLINNETLNLVWRGNSKMQDLDTVYTVTLYDTDGGNTPLYQIEITWKDLADTMQQNNGIATLQLKKYNASGVLESGADCNFPLSYSKGSFTLTLDAMVDATILRAYENAPAVGKTQMFSIDRLVAAPTQLKAGVSVKPVEELKDNYIVDGKEKETNIENSHFATMKKADGTTPAAYTMTYYRHLYNTRWMPATTHATFTLQKKDSIDHFDWYSGNVVLYTAPATAATRPKAANPNKTEAADVAWPTIPVWGEQMSLTNSAAATGRVTLANLQLRSSSVAAVKKTADDTFDKYVGLIGENHGRIENLTLQDANALVNADSVPYGGAALAAGELLYTPADGTAALLQAATAALDARPHLEAVGTVCGLSTGTIENISLTKSKTGTAQLLAAVPFTDAQKTVTAAAPPHGVGGVVGVAMPRATESAALKLANLAAPEDMTVAGLLPEQTAAGAPVNGTAPHETEAEEKARYNNAALEPAVTGNALWRAIGVGGLVGVYDATATATGPTNLTNAATVAGSGFTGGVVGNLYSTAGARPTLDGLANTGTVTAGNHYKTGSALGQFFGGLAGYAKNVNLQNCTGSMSAALTSAAVTTKIQSGFGTGGALKDASPLKGDFVGGLVGFGNKMALANYRTDPGYVMGHTFVGGFVGGTSGSTLFGTGVVTNASNVFGHRYVGGAVAINGAGSTIRSATNKGLISAMGTNSAYVGGMAAVNDATWGDQTAAGPATISSCTNLSSTDQYTDTRNANFLQGISTVDGEGVYTACFVGGITGYNGKDGTLFLDAAAPQVKAVLYGGHYVGGVAGYNAPDAGTITGSNITVNGTIWGRGDCVGGFIGMNRKAHGGTAEAALPDDLSIAVNSIRGCYCVGGVIGANLPQGSFAVPAATGMAGWRTGAGSLNANGAAGGILGYNQVQAGGIPLAGKTEAEKLRHLLPKIGSDGVLAEPISAPAATTRLAGAENRLNINANLYVGGILGYNASTTALTIQGAVNGAVGNLGVGGIGKNANPLRIVTAAGADVTPLAVDFNAALAQLGSQYDASKLAPDGTTGFAGGILGINNGLATLDGCANYGSILGHNTVVGGMAALNLGTIQNCTQSANLGNTQPGYLYVGGIAGINMAATAAETTSGGIISKSGVAPHYTILGENYVGGLVGANRTPRPGVSTPADLGAADKYGSYIEEPAASGYTVRGANDVGGVAGINYGTVTGNSGHVSLDVSADSTCAGGIAGRNAAGGYLGAFVREGGAVAAANRAGGMAGENAGTIRNCANGKDDNTGGTVMAAAQYAGGIAGYNSGLIESSKHPVKSNSPESAPVLAETGFAGGIAGYNDTAGQIAACEVSGGVRAAQGEAGGITAHNKGLVDGGKMAAVDDATRIYGTAQALGAAAAYNEGTVQNVGMAAPQSDKSKRPHLAGPATRVGALVGSNTGTVQHCTVENNSMDFAGLTASSITLGGAVGVNENAAALVDDVRVTLAMTENTAKYIDLGGVVGGNHGTVAHCAYSGKLGHAGDTAARLRDTVGGLAGYNSGTVSDSKVESIALYAQGAFAVDASQSAEEKLNNASHVGGAVGRNDGTLRGVTVATTEENIVSAQYGFVGGVAGSNSGTVSTSGGHNTQDLVSRVATWLDHDGKTTADKNALIQQMAAQLETDVTKDADTGVFTVTPAAYADLLGHDAVNNPGAPNNLLVTLAGGDTVHSRGNGYLGGLAGFNAATGQIADSATGRWFVYGSNIEPAAAMGGAIGQNEAARELKHLVNCAAVRRFCRTEDGAAAKDDNWNANNQGGEEKREINDHVGGLIGVQQNRTESGWKITGCVNWGSVFNSRSNNVGGIASYLAANGGSITRCYNFGYLACNTTYNRLLGAGTIGGIAGYFDKPTSGDTINILSCRNYGGIYGVNESGEKMRRANDCAGIFGKTMLTNATDPLTINIFDCVNEAPVIQANSVVAGVIAWLGPTANIENVALNIDRCRNLCIHLECLNGNAIAGISGNRGQPWTNSYTAAATTITNCFVLYNVPMEAWVNPIYYNPTHTDHVNAGNNYYMRPCSFDAAYNTGFRDLNRDYGTNAATGTKGDVPYDAYFGKLLYAGQDKGAAESDSPNRYSYFGALLKWGQDDTAKLDNIHYKIEANGTGGFGNPAVMRTIYCDNGAIAADLPLLFNEVDGNGKPSWGDVTDDVVQNYYEYLLDSTLPAAAANVAVARSEDTANVYGKYLATWDAPENSNNVTDYLVEVLVEMDSAGSPGVFTVQDTKAVYNCETTIEGKAAWSGKKFKIRVTTHNTKGYGPAAVSAETNFAQNMPRPDLEARLVKTATGYAQWLVLKNTADYCTKLSGNTDWNVTVTADGAALGTISPALGTTNLGEYYIKLEDAAAGRKNYRAFAEPTGSSPLKDEWMRSELFNENLYVPNIATAKGLAEGVLTLGSADITVTGTTVNDLSVAATLKFAPTNAGLAPRYAVGLVGKAKAGSAPVIIDGQTADISGQYVVLAGRANAVQPAGTTITLSNLPSDTLTEFEDWRLVAYPTGSGEGPVTTVYNATGTEVTAALSASGDLRTAAALELTRTAGTTPGAFTYTARHATALGYLGAGAPGQMREIPLSDKVNVLMAPTLQAFPPSPAPYCINANNELAYTFTWKQTDETGPDVGASRYEVALYGVAADGAETQIPFKAGYDPYDTAAPAIAYAAGAYTYTLNIEKDLQNGSESWHFDKVRLQVTRKVNPAADPKQIGAAGSKTYAVKTRLAKVAAPGAVSPTTDAYSSATALNYTITWPAITDTTHLANYTLYAEKYDGSNWAPALKADGTTPLCWNTPDANPTLTVNLEANQGDTLRFYAVAISNDTQVLNGPNGVPDAGSVVMTRQPAPALGSLDFSHAAPNMEEFLNNLTLKFASTGGEADSSYYFAGYLFQQESAYNAALAAVKAWQNPATPLTPAEQAEKYQELCDLLAGQVADRVATLMVAGDSVNVGQSAQGNGAAVSYTLAPDPNGFTLWPEHAGQYLLVGLHTMPPSSSDKAPSAWSFYTPGTAATLPAIKLDAPSVTPVSTEYTAAARLYLNADETDVPTDRDLTTSHTTLAWQPVDSYTKADGTTTNLTAQYEVKITPNTAGITYPAGYNQNPYTIRMTVAPRDIRGTATPPDLQYKRGAIIRVEKTYDGTNYFEIPLITRPDGTSYYDLSLQTSAISATQPVAVKGRVKVEVGGMETNFYYKQLCVPRLTVAPEGDTVSYRVILPDLSAPVTATDVLQTFTSAVSVTACNEEQVQGDDYKAGYRVENSDPTDWEHPAAAALFAAAPPLRMPATPETAALPEQPPAA